MNRQDIERNFILDEIRRTAKESGGRPLGRARFYSETGIREADWSGKYWARWGDAVREAGLEANSPNVAYAEDYLLVKLASLIQELGRFPVEAELRMKARQDSEFPSHNAFRRLGGRSKIAARLAEYCRQREGYADVAEVCAGIADKPEANLTRGQPDMPGEFGSVYLMKSGRYYKIGRTNSTGRRERELAIQLPEKIKVVHQFRTDDPMGIENYWHRRFEGRRKNGEWFELTSEDVAAFRRRRFFM